MAKMMFPLAAAVAAIAAPQIAHAAGDPVVGGKMFIQCRACHTINAGDRNGVGPNLNGVVGRKAGTRAGYSYSPAMTASGVAWTAVTLDAFLARPSAKVPGTKMAFAGVAAKKTRDDIIAYLASVPAPKR